jgi:hypothetical protein
MCTHRVPEARSIKQKKVVGPMVDSARGLWAGQGVAIAIRELQGLINL